MDSNIKIPDSNPKVNINEQLDILIDDISKQIINAATDSIFADLDAIVLSISNLKVKTLQKFHNFEPEMKRFLKVNIQMTLAKLINGSTDSSSLNKSENL